MKTVAFVLLAGVSLSALRNESNSHAQATHGRKAFETKEYAQAAKHFAKAQEVAPSTLNAFNLGTAQIAEGRREEGSATLARALEDPNLTADAYFNRGNSALAAKALDHAVADYVQALRANPSHTAAKRNLEIALARRESEQRQSRSQQNQQQQKQNQPQQPQQPNGAKPQAGQMDADALLRSVQQQEQEELRRMKARAASEGPIGW
jgi:Ca-activated chloride channel family protein